MNNRILARTPAALSDTAEKLRLPHVDREITTERPSPRPDISQADYQYWQ